MSESVSGQHKDKVAGSVDTLVSEPVFRGDDTFDGPSDGGAVNVKDAMDQYEELKRTLSQISRQETKESDKALEEGAQQSFDLDDFLHSIATDLDEAGYTRKHLGVVWRNLSVEGLGASEHTISTVVSGVLKALQFWKYIGIGQKKSVKVILKEQTGFCKDGEMLLVLGRPGAGCTTLLRVISNMRGTFTKVDGDLSYGGIDHRTFASRFRGQTAYNSEEDQHYPTLTTKQTLQLALRTKSAGMLVNNSTKEDFMNRILYMLGNMLGLTKQMHTMVGNAFVRGLSGGERKRLSIAEQMTTQSTVNCWDCSTRGLDAASALDFVKSLRIMTNVLQKTTIASLYQASNSIYEQFDKVLLLDEGHCLYFGPGEKALEYFDNLGFHRPPRKSIPDYLTGLCNPLEREIKPGFESTAPQHASEFSERYLQSDIYRDMMTELEDYEALIEKDNPAEKFKKAFKEEHQKRAHKSSPYTASFFQQVKALTIRQYHLLIKDRQALISRYGTILIQAFITASCFYNIPHTGSGSFARGGAIFFSVLFNSFISQSELVRFLTGRPVLEKHKQYALYRPSAFYLAQVVMDIPYAIAQVLLYEIIAYFMMGLNLNAGSFFTFFIVLFFMNMCMNGFFRVCGAITPSFFYATNVSGVLLIALVTYCGYVIPYRSMHPWLFWIYWIDPIGYAYKSLLINEMSGQVYTCDAPGNAVPFGPSYTNWDYMVCTMKGGVPGESFVRGDDYLVEALSYYPSQKWAPDFVAVVAFFLLFTAICALSMEYLGRAKVGSLTKLYVPGKAPKPRTEEEEDERRRRQAKITEDIDTVSNGTTFSWHHVNYSVPFQGSNLQLLNDISGIVRPGHLTALMGSSGAGKTTLLDVLARRKTLGKVGGRLYLNNEALMDDFERLTAYCEQMDIHQPAVTVREGLRFAAYLRQPAEVPKKEKEDYVEKIIQLLEMEDIADAQIGDVDTGFGISVEERKRLTIGMELVGKPQLLFLDEPTSGLDAQSSYNIIRFIRKLADAGWPVLCTIHQPSAILFEHFDHLLLLVRGGRTAYYGEIGPDARTMIEYFESNGGPKCSEEANPAEYILSVVGAGTAGKVTRDWADIWDKSPHAQQLEDELESIHQKANQNPNRQVQAYAASFWTQFNLVHKRMALAYWRAVDYNIGRFLIVMFTSLITGFTFWKLSNSSTDLMNREFALFSSFIMANILIILAQPKFMVERLYFRREYASRYYGWIPFGLSVILVEIPYILFLAAFYLFGFYWTAGMNQSSEAIGYFYLMSIFFVFWAVVLGFVIASCAENPTMASVINPLIISLLILFAGMMQTPSAMPHFWSSWMYPLNPFHYFIEGLSVNELRDLKIECNDADMINFLPPPGQTCGDYTAAFFESGATGYIGNPNATNPEYCNYCSYSSGEEFYSSMFGWSAANQWRNIGIIAAYFVFNVFVFLGLVYWKRKALR